MFEKEIVVDNKNTSLYSPEKGYGICDIHVDSDYIQGIVNGREVINSQVAPECGGWNPRRTVSEITEESEVTEASEESKVREESIESNGSESYGSGLSLAPRSVEIIRIDVPEFGTYRVDVDICGSGKVALYAGRRNMVENNIEIDDKTEYSYHRSFYQAVMPYIPALTSKRNNTRAIFVSVASLNTDNTINLSIKVTREDVPVIWIAGDSTLTDQNADIPYYPYGSCAGWAQTLLRYIKGAAVCNLAHSGMTSNCFRDDGHYDIALEYVKKGDYFIMQFGHNDQKRRNLNAYGGYSDNLRRYVSEVRQKGATPIICSPISRIPLEMPGEGHYSLLSSYANAAENVAKELKVAFVDLHEFTFKKWIEYGDKAKDFFMKGDITHTNEYGAVLICDYFMSCVRAKSAKDNDFKLNSSNMSYKESDAVCCGCSNKRTPEEKCNKEVNNCLEQYDNREINAFPEQYDNNREEIYFNPDSDTKELPKRAAEKDIFEIIEPPYVDIQGIPEYEGIKKAFRYGLLDPCVMYLHPYEPMPRAQLLMVMFKAFRMAGVRPYKGAFADIRFDEWDSGYVQALLERGLVDDDTLSAGAVKKPMFRPDDPLTYGELAKFLVKKLELEQKKEDRVTKADGRYKGTQKHDKSTDYLKIAINLGIFDEVCDEDAGEAYTKEGITDDLIATNEVVNNSGTSVSGTSIRNISASCESARIASSIITADTIINRAEVYTALARFMDIEGNVKTDLPADIDKHPVN